MSILIKGMEMPTNCGDCYFEQIGAEEDVYGAEEDVYGDTCISYCLLTEWRIALSNRDDMKLPSCPLVEIDDTEWEWCHDCKEYDQESHCCHRWTKVIRKTVAELEERYGERRDDEGTTE